MKKLRGPEGCPWDIKQTHMSIRECILEEAYELIDAIQNEDTENLIEELGDVLLQVVFHSQIAKEEGYFSIDDVAAHICKKMIKRHPHVFGDGYADNADQVLRNWEEIKNSEKALEKFSDKFSFIPKSMPAVIRSYEIQKIAAESGFDWPDEQGALEKMKEEIEELAEAYSHKEIRYIEEELGDLVFAIINFARFMKINPEIAVNNTNEKFIKRFMYMEENAEKSFKEMTLEEMDSLWEKSKGH